MTGLIAHEWIAPSGGSENVLEAMSKTFPEADMFCLWNDSEGRFPNERITESLLARTPLRRSKALSLPFMPWVWRNVPLDRFDWTLVSSHLFAHHIGTAASRINHRMHVYVHTPARYIWTPELDKRGQNALVRAAAPFFQGLDKRRAAEGAQFAANSAFVRDRIRKTWDQDAQVIYPPVSVSKLKSNKEWTEVLNVHESTLIEALPETYILGASRFVPYKQLDDVISAGEACGLPVVLAGAGPQRKYLGAIAEEASVPVHIIDAPSNQMLYALIQQALVYVFPPVEDFGILPVEAMTLGTPTIVNSIGGAVESVRALGGGTDVPVFHGAVIRTAIDEVAESDMSSAIARSEVFSEESYGKQLRDWIQSSEAKI